MGSDCQTRGRNIGSALREEGLGGKQTRQTRKARTGNQVAKMRAGAQGDKSQYVKEEHLVLIASHSAIQKLW